MSEDINPFAYTQIYVTDKEYTTMFKDSFDHLLFNKLFYQMKEVPLEERGKYLLKSWEELSHETNKAREEK